MVDVIILALALTVILLALAAVFRRHSYSILEGSIHLGRQGHHSDPDPIPVDHSDVQPADLLEYPYSTGHGLPPPDIRHIQGLASWS